KASTFVGPLFRRYVSLSAADSASSTNRTVSSPPAGPAAAAAQRRIDAVSGSHGHATARCTVTESRARLIARGGPGYAPPGRGRPAPRASALPRAHRP